MAEALSTAVKKRITATYHPTMSHLHELLVSAVALHLASNLRRISSCVICDTNYHFL